VKEMMFWQRCHNYKKFGEILLSLAIFLSGFSHSFLFPSGIPGTRSGSEAAQDPECPRRPQRDSAFFIRTRIQTRSQKFVKNRTRNRSHFSISGVAGVCVVIS